MQNFSALQGKDQPDFEWSTDRESKVRENEDLNLYFEALFQLWNEVRTKIWEAKSLLNLSTLKPFELLFMVLVTYEHLEQIRCVFYLWSLLPQVQLLAKLVGKIDSFFQYTTPELYTYPTFVLKKTKER